MGDLSIADILDRAADLIEPEGRWTQGGYARGKSGRLVKSRAAATCFCAIGAIDYADGATPGDESNWAAIVAVDAVLPTGEFLAEWNDAPERTQKEVVAKLREAATLARGNPS